MRRYENRSTIMTSNRPVEEWGKLLGDVPTACAILNRFLHHAQTIAITGRSYRLKDHATVPEKRIKPKRPNPSPTNLRPQNRRAEWLAFRFCSFYFAADRLWTTYDYCFRPEVGFNMRTSLTEADHKLYAEAHH